MDQYSFIIKKTGSHKGTKSKSKAVLARKIQGLIGFDFAITLHFFVSFV